MSGFDSAGTFSAVSGATDAFSGQVLSSVTWNAINTAYDTALTQLGTAQFVRAIRVISSSGSFTIAALDRFVYVQAPAPTIVMPACATKLCPVTIYGAASTVFGSNSSTIVPNGVETINGAASQVLNQNYESVTLMPLASGGYVADIAQQGVVTSVALAMPNIFGVSGSPVTTSGTLTATLTTQLPALVLASSNSGATAVPTFRALVNADLTGVSTLAALTSHGTIVTGVWNAGSVTAAGIVSSTGSHIAQSATAIAAGGGTPGKGVLFSSTANFGIFFGSGAPTIQAALGSMYLRSDGSSTSTRAYFNTDGTVAWTNATTAA